MATEMHASDPYTPTAINTTKIDKKSIKCLLGLLNVIIINAHVRLDKCFISQECDVNNDALH